MHVWCARQQGFRENRLTGLRGAWQNSNVHEYVYGKLRHKNIRQARGTQIHHRSAI